MFLCIFPKNLDEGSKSLAAFSTATPVELNSAPDPRLFPRQLSYSSEEDASLMHMKHVAGDEIWLKANPGQQGLLTGSFHPMSV